MKFSFSQYTRITCLVRNVNQVQIGRSHTKSDLFDVPFILALSCLTDSCSNCAPPLQSVKSFYSCNYEAELMFMPDGVYGNSTVECRLS